MKPKSETYKHKYKLLYKIEKPPDGVMKEEVPEGFGATDALLVTSIIYPPDGSLSIFFIGKDGRRSEKIGEATLDDREWFKVWAMLATRLANSTTLQVGKRDICRSVHEIIRDSIVGPGKEK